MHMHVGGGGWGAGATTHVREQATSEEQSNLNLVFKLARDFIS